jgi:chromosome segregation ATPase
MNKTTNKPHILKINDNLHKLTTILGDIETQMRIMKSDIDSIKSYINQQEERKKLDLPQVEEVSKGWFFS